MRYFMQLCNAPGLLYIRKQEPSQAIVASTSKRENLHHIGTFFTHIARNVSFNTPKRPELSRKTLPFQCELIYCRNYGGVGQLLGQGHQNERLQAD
jgi:hypothetical protein